MDLIPVPRYRHWEMRERCPHCGWRVQVFWLDPMPPYTGMRVPLHVPRICTRCATMWELDLRVMYS